MSERCKIVGPDSIEPGDWVCFQQMGVPAYGRVEYIRPGYSEDSPDVVTTVVTCSMKDILEVRKPTP